MVSEADSKNSISLLEEFPSSVQFSNNTSKRKTKAKLIDFDKNGKGYETNVSRLSFKESERPTKTSLETIEPLNKEETMFMVECKRLGECDILEEPFSKKILKQIAEKEFQLLASKKEKDARSVEEVKNKNDILNNIEKTKNREKSLENS